MSTLVTKTYNPKEIEPKWQKIWEEKGIYQTEEEEGKPCFYALEMFPYPSGRLHMGHMRVYSIGDVISRFKRMNGYQVLHPMGWDAFGLPAENAAIQRGIHPRKWTLENIEQMKKQQKQLGVSYDWEREIATCLPEYYRFTQELFLLLYERGLAYRKKAAVNWCPSCTTVLANEQVENGKCWRCDSEVVKKELEQWFFKITDYAERLLQDLEKLDGWPERVRTMQRNWIGKSTGAEVVFTIPEIGEQVSVFTTRPDTLYGVTCLVLAPEHPLVPRLVKGKETEAKVLAFVEQMRRESEITRTAADADKIGLFTGAYAEHPLTREQIPIWIANYVLVDYGTGAVMVVPAHDERDFQFAKKYNLPVKVVIQNHERSLVPEEMTGAYVEDGVMVNSGPFDGMNSREGIAAVSRYLSEHAKGGPTVSYRIRDWLISRQRYWGCPIPIVYCDHCGVVPVPKEQLPVLLPDDVVFDGKRNPLTTSESFVHTTCPKCHAPARRETDTMDTFIDSSWYFYRYTSVNEMNRPFDPEKVKKWLPVDKYIGGIEHAVLHLLYARFFTKVLYDAGWVAHQEPFKSLLTQGMVIKDGAKMSKSKGNVVSPDEIVEKYGADTGRLFILFAAPPDRDLDWSDSGVEGCHRFLNRVWRLVEQSLYLFGEQRSVPDPRDESSKALHRLTHYSIKKVTEDIEERYHFNTAISAIMELVNGIQEFGNQAESGTVAKAIETMLLLLAPFAPHITEELWHMIGHQESIHQQAWPTYDPAALVLDEVEIAVQINGKMRAKLMVPTKAGNAEVEQMVLSDSRVQPHLEGRNVRKVIVVPGKLVNIVVG